MESIQFKSFLNGLTTEKDEIVEAWEKEQHEGIIKSYIEKSRIPEDYQRVSFDDLVYETEQGETFKKKVQYFENEILNNNYLNLLMTGPAGVGKTFSASAILIDYLHKYKEEYYGEKIIPRVYYIKSSEMVREYQRTKSFTSEITAQEYIENTKFWKLLCIDEIGRYTDATEKELIFEILDLRQHLKLPTIFISNLGFEEACEYLGAAVMDRLKHTMVLADGTELRSKR